MPLEAGGGIPCRPNPAATLPVIRDFGRITLCVHYNGSEDFSWPEKLISLSIYLIMMTIDYL